MNKEFANLCDWFVGNKLSIHFGEDKTKCILFSRDKNLPEISITCGDNIIKQYCVVEYLGCCLDAKVSGKSMATKPLRKINTKIQSYNSYINRMSF